MEFEDAVAYEAGFEQVVPQMPEIGPTAGLVAAMDCRVQKLLVFQPGRPIEELYQAVGSVVVGQAVPAFSGLSFIELAAGLVTKATALEHLADDLGIEVAEVATFGDNHNDVAMLGWAGRSTPWPIPPTTPGPPPPR